MSELIAAWEAVRPYLAAMIPAPERLPGLIWDTVRFILYFSVIYVAFKVVNRLTLIREIVTGFNKAKSPIWDMRSTIEDFKSTIDELSKLEPIIQTVRSQIALLDEKIDAAQKQVEELQRHSASERTEAPASADLPIPTSHGLIPPAGDEANWQKLREIWRAHVERLEELIDGLDGRKSRPYRKMTRYDYKPIIDRLQDDGLLTPAAAKASKELMETFSSYRPRNRRIPDSVVGEMIVLDRLLASELAPSRIKAKEMPEDKPERLPIPTDQPVDIALKPLV